MKWSGDNVVYLEKKSKEFRKHFRRLNNIKRKVTNYDGHDGTLGRRTRRTYSKNRPVR